MALTITIEGKGVIANADASPDTAMTGSAWNEVGGGADSFTTDTFLYGSTSFAGAYSNKSGYQYYDIGSANILDFDTGGTEVGQHIYMWIHCPTIGLLETKANKGLTIRLGNDLTNNYREFLIAGSDDSNGWNGEWKCFVIDPTKTGSVADTGTFDVGAIRYFGIWIDTKALAKGDNIFISQISVGKGVRILGTSTVGWKDVVDYCVDYPNRAWGMFQERDGIYYQFGKANIGNTTQAANVSFTDSGRIIQFGTSEYWNGTAWVTLADIDYAGIDIQDHASYTTTFSDGVIVGTDNGRSGSVFIGNDNHDITLDLYGGNNATSLTTCYGTSFKNLTGVFNSGNDADHKFLGCSFGKCHQFDPVGAPVIRNCTFAEVNQNAAAHSAALLWNSNIDIQDCQFIANNDPNATYVGHGIEHTVAASIIYTNLEFSGNEKDVWFSATTGNLVASKNGSSNQSTYTNDSTGTVTFPGSVTVSVTVVDSDNVAITTANVRVEETDGTLVTQGNVDGSGIYLTSYAGSTPLSVVLKVRSSSSGETRYFSIKTAGTIASSTGLITTVTMIKDLIATA